MRVSSLFFALLLAGCGSSSGGPPPGTPPEAAVPNAVGLPAAAGTGRAYVITSTGGLEIFTGLNQVQGGLQPNLRLTLPRSGPLTIAHDPSDDQLCIACTDGSLLIYENARLLTAASTPSAIIPLPGVIPTCSALDQPHDLLYLGASNGRLARVTGISQANNSTRPTFVNVTTAAPPAPSPAPPGPPPTLNILLGLASNPAPDLLFAAGAATPGNVRTLSTYSGASAAFSFAGLVSPGGLRSAQGVGMAVANRLLIMDQETETTFRLKRYEPANNYAGNATLSLEAPVASVFTYDARSDVLYVGGETVLAYPNASRLTGNVTASSAAGELLLQTGAARGLAVDPSR